MPLSAESWGRPPNFLLVDYYNVGNGSVFKVAASLNGVKYEGGCCGQPSSAVKGIELPLSLGAVASWVRTVSLLKYPLTGYRSNGDMRSVLGSGVCKAMWI